MQSELTSAAIHRIFLFTSTPHNAPYEESSTGWFPALVRDTDYSGSDRLFQEFQRQFLQPIFRLAGCGAGPIICRENHVAAMDSLSSGFTFPGPFPVAGDIWRESGRSV